MGDVHIAKVIKTSVSIQGLVDLDGAHIQMTSVDEVPVLVPAVMLGGLSIVEDVCVPLSPYHSCSHAALPFKFLPKWGTTLSTFEFWVSLIKELHKNKGSLDAPLPFRSTIPSKDVDSPGVDEAESDMDDNVAQEDNAFERTIGKCFNAAIRQWDSVPRTQSIPRGTHQRVKNPNPD
jgi:hypothetical protein